MLCTPSNPEGEDPITAGAIVTYANQPTDGKVLRIGDGRGHEVMYLTSSNQLHFSPDFEPTEQARAFMTAMNLLLRKNIFPTAFQKPIDRYQLLVKDYYLDERHCDHCRTGTMHNCKDSAQERDSSGDYQECRVCGWWKSGYEDKYYAPR